MYLPHWSNKWLRLSIIFLSLCTTCNYLLIDLIVNITSYNFVVPTSISTGLCFMWSTAQFLYCFNLLGYFSALNKHYKIWKDRACYISTFFGYYAFKPLYLIRCRYHCRKYIEIYTAICAGKIRNWNLERYMHHWL